MKFTALLKFETLKQTKTLMFFTVVWAALIFLFMSLFDTILANADQLKSLYTTFPKELLEAFGKGVESLTSIYGYFGDQIMIYIVLSGCILTVFITAGTIAKEIENKNMLFLLSKPVSRLQIYFSKFLAIVAALMVSNTILFIVTVIAILLFTSQRNLDWSFFVLDFIALFLLELFFASITELIGAKFGSGKSIAIGSLVVISSYLLNILSGLAKEADAIKYLSANYYINLKSLASDRAFKPEVLVIVILTILFISIGGYLFKTRDIN